MAFHTQSSFAAGELDPALRERTTFDKYQSGLATSRNSFIGKTGRVISRPGLKLFKATKYDDKKCVIISPPYSQYIIEWGHQYVRIHDTTSPGTFTDDAHDFLETDLPNLQFTPSGKYLYITRIGKKIKKMVIGALDIADPLLDTRFLSDSDMFEIPIPYAAPGPLPVASLLATYGTGLGVEYRATFIVKGQESSVSNNVGGGKRAINPAEYSVLRMDVTNCLDKNRITEVRWYRRPLGGNAYGYVGSASTPVLVGGTNLVFDFSDIGEDADYTNSFPTPDFDPAPQIFGHGPEKALSRAAAIYQQRLILSESQNEEAIHASRTGYQNNFFRDYPLEADSALTFKAGTSGNAKVLRFLDNNGLLVFTTTGIYTNQGALTPDNLSFDKKGNWVIEERVPPLEIPGGVIFVDKSTNTVRTLIYSNEAGGYPGEEISIFSNHLFMNKKVVSWSFQDGDTPLVWTVFDDGSLAALTYQREHQMQAWSRHDTQGNFESTTVLKDLDNRSIAYFVIKRGTKRYIEYLSPRFVSNPKELCIMDSAVSYSGNYGALAGGVIFNITALDINDWAGELYVTSQNYVAFTNVADQGAVGTIWRFFDSQGSAVDLTVTEYVDNYRVKVQPSVEFPEDQGVGAVIWVTQNVFTGLDHLNGKMVSVLVDGYVYGSPNNNIDNFKEYLILGGKLQLPNNKRGAFVHIGLPYTADVETLDIDSVEQKPVTLESKITPRVFLKVYNTRGLYVGSRFADNDQVDGMTDPEVRTEDIALGNVGNAAQVPYTKRIEVQIPNDWDSNGRVCIRQVDPLPFEILSIIPDFEVPSY